MKNGRVEGRIWLSPPHLSGREIELVRDAFESNWIAPLGPHVDAFEAELAKTVSVRNAAALSSGTAALHLALRLLGVSSGDHVLCSTLTFAASAFAIDYVGARPVFVDCEARSWNVDPERLSQAIDELSRCGRPPTAAILVDLYGQSVDWNPIQEVCKEHGVPIIEDAAEALGATYLGRPVGGFGKLGVFSFNGNKIITTSGGGMLVSDDEELIEKARFLATQARDPAPHYQHSEIGFNYRMSNLLAAVGRGQLQTLSDRVATRRRIFNRYVSGLGDLPGVKFMPEIRNGFSTRWLTCLTIEPEESNVSRDDVRLALENKNIESRPIWKPMHLQPVFSREKRFGGRVSEGLFETGLCLPSGSNLTDHDLTRVIDEVRAVFKA